MSFLEVFTNPSLAHAAIVHMPIALAVAGIPLVYLCAVAVKDNEALRWVTAGCYALAAACAFAAMQTGESAMGRVPADLPKDIWDHINRHEAMGEAVWKLAAVTALLMAFSAIKVRWFNTSVLAAAMLASLATGGWVAVTGHFGGTLVYKYGVGTPAMKQGAPAPSAPAGGTNQSAPSPIDPPAIPTDPASFSTPAKDDGLQPSLLPFTMDEARKVSYTRDVKPLLAEVCEDCHHPGKERGGLDVTSVASLLRGGTKAGPAIIPGDPDTSPLVKYLRGALQPQMPKGEDPIFPEELRTIRMWIAAGAVDDSAKTGDAEPPPTVTGEAPASAGEAPEAAPPGNGAPAPETAATGASS